jgi:flagellar basal body rod protein FlgC
VVATNIVNAGSAGHTVKGALETGTNAQSPYSPMAVSTYSVQGGGVAVAINEVNPSTLSVYAPQHSLSDSDGNVAFPNGSFAEQLIEIKLTTISYKANARVFASQSELLGSLLDSIS